STEFVTLLRPHRKSDRVPNKADLKPIRGGYVLTAAMADGRVVALLPTDDSATLVAEGLKTTGQILVQRRSADGGVVETVRVEQ
ncbi:MAG: hypothetical protein ACYTG0_24005, partial [Planctomycetota bacterium]